MNDPILKEIANVSCRRMGNFAYYTFCHSTMKVKFGERLMSVTEVCNMFPEVPARSIQVIAPAGPPGKPGWYKITLSELLQDWYWYATALDNELVLSKFRHTLQGPSKANRS